MAQPPRKEKPASLGPPKNSNSYRAIDHSSSCFMSACCVPGFMLSTIYHPKQQGQEDRYGRGHDTWTDPDHKTKTGQPGNLGRRYREAERHRARQRQREG